MKLFGRTAKMTAKDFSAEQAEWQALENDFAGNDIDRQVLIVAGNKKLTKALKNWPEVILVTVENGEITRHVVAEIEGESLNLMDAEHVRE